MSNTSVQASRSSVFLVGLDGALYEVPPELAAGYRIAPANQDQLEQKLQSALSDHGDSISQHLARHGLLPQESEVEGQGINLKRILASAAVAMLVGVALPSTARADDVDQFGQDILDTSREVYNGDGPEQAHPVVQASRAVVNWFIDQVQQDIRTQETSTRESSPE